MKIVLKFLKKFLEKNPPNIWGGQIVKKNFWKKIDKMGEMIYFYKNLIYE